MWGRSFFGAIDLQKTSAVCALEPLWYVHKRRPIGVGDQAQVSTVEGIFVASNRLSASARLLRNVDLLFFINVAEEINQATNKGNYRQRERDPS